MSIITVLRRRSYFEAVRLEWSTWSDVCSLIPFHRFVRGVWVDPSNVEKHSDSPFPNVLLENQRIGLLVKDAENRVRLVNQGMWILYDDGNDEILILDENEFNVKFEILPTEK